MDRITLQDACFELGVPYGTVYHNLHKMREAMGITIEGKRIYCDKKTIAEIKKKLTGYTMVTKEVYPKLNRMERSKRLFAENYIQIGCLGFVRKCENKA